MEKYTKPSDLEKFQIERIKFAIDVLGVMANGNAYEKGFYDDHIKMCQEFEMVDIFESYYTQHKLSRLALVHSEISEASEAVRKPGPDEHLPEFTSEEVEVADAIVRLLDYSEHCGLRIAEALLAKMEYNASRPYKHGKKA